MKNRFFIRLAALAFAFLLTNYGHAQNKTKHRVIVITDIEADPDDTESLVRFLTYSNQWDVEGLIATTSIWQKTRVAPESIVAVLKQYAKVQPNLLKHETGYPSYAQLIQKVSKGLPVFGMEGVGEGHDSPGSELIRNELEKNDPRPVWFCVWGGVSPLAQALWKIKKTETAQRASGIYKKVRVYTISDQDDSGPWIRKTFPDIFYVCSPGYTYGKATWLGMSFVMPGSNRDVVSNEWLAKNIQQGHGPLGAAYPDLAYGMEGDTPSFLGLIDNGMNDPEHPDYGGWGGRYELYTPAAANAIGLSSATTPAYEPETRPFWTNAEDSVYVTRDKQGYKSIQATIWRWREEYQNDFAARMAWCTKSYKDANHPPVVKLKHADHFTVKSGETFHLNALGTYDPDGDSLSYLWFAYPEAGTYKGKISFAPHAANLYDEELTAPAVDTAETIHFILKVTDKGTPALTRYKRVIVTVLPK